MAKALLITLFYLVNFTGAAMGSYIQNNISQEQLCINSIESYQIPPDFSAPNRSARAEHLQDLIKKSNNRYKLINDIYLHYRSIDDSFDPLSLRIENCLVNLLHISTEAEKFTSAIFQRNKLTKLFLPSKLQDPLHELIAENVVNAKFILLNEFSLVILSNLDKQESNFSDNVKPNKSDFDSIFYIGIEEC